MKSNHLILGILAHVDAGKTTLSEGILYLSGAIRKMGRVDHQDAFLDTDHMEKARGITIYSKQAEFPLGEKTITLLDTPGHVDFSPEMERALQMMDAAVLVISAPDGVTGQVRVLWKLLQLYRMPVFLFVNKMDQPGMDRGDILAQLQAELDDKCLPFQEDLSSEEWQESLALCDEKMMDFYLEGNAIETDEIKRLIMDRRVFPVYFGSALKMQEVDRLLDGMDQYLSPMDYPSDFGARVYKISRDEQGNRLTWMKITGGSLKVKTVLSGEGRKGPWEDKVDQIRIYSGSSFEPVQEVSSGEICAVTGLPYTWSGEGIGAETDQTQNMLSPVLTYSIIPPEDAPLPAVLGNLRRLEEEEPMLHVAYSEQKREISVQIMGQVQMDIIKDQMLSRFGQRISFGPGSIVYKETILEPVVGVGHFEPLRHYAEVQLLMEPTAPGTGLTFSSLCPEDEFGKTFQKQVLSHLQEKQHKGVLTGSDITDMRISILAGRSHVKHTEGGDFREASYRAIRQGLMCAKNILLEPFYDFRLKLPAEYIGRAMTDLQQMGGSVNPPETDGSNAILTGCAPASGLNLYQEDLTAYSRGQGHLFYTFAGYKPCRDAERVIKISGYDPDQDKENPSCSVFVHHGVTTLVPWDMVSSYQHTDRDKSSQDNLTALSDEEQFGTKEDGSVRGFVADRQKMSEAALSFKERQKRYEVTQNELNEIFARTYRTSADKEEDRADRRQGWKHRRRTESASYSNEVHNARKNHLKNQGSSGKAAGRSADQEYLLVDGYNIIFAWPDLRELAAKNIDAARDRLIDILSDYQGYRGCTLILVFDAYRVKEGKGSWLRYHNIHVVFTKEAETADQYIEKTVHEIGHKYRVQVATSDALEQMIILGEGAQRISAAGLQEEIGNYRRQLREEYLTRLAPGGRNRPFEELLKQNES